MLGTRISAMLKFVLGGASRGFMVGLLLMSGGVSAEQSPSALTPDPKIATAMQQVSADRIRQTVETLVSFQNRSTLSAQDADSIKAGKGIGAAREWIKSEFERYSKVCAGCLEVKTDSFVEQPGGRIPQATTITNV